MLENYNLYRILQEFFYCPRKYFQIRELSRRLNLAQISIINHLNKLLKEGLVIREKKGVYPSFRANQDNWEFKLLKKQNMVWLIYKSKLIDYIDEKIKPDCVVLFGSSARGEDVEESDIDLFVQSEEKQLELKNYERLLKRRINIIFESDIKSLSKELLNNIINGQILYGYLKVF